jgi:hypothetical protein
LAHRFRPDRVTPVTGARKYQTIAAGQRVCDAAHIGFVR